jgi:hypothetical protein
LIQWLLGCTKPVICAIWTRFSNAPERTDGLFLVRALAVGLPLGSGRAYVFAFGRGYLPGRKNTLAALFDQLPIDLRSVRAVLLASVSFVRVYRALERAARASPLKFAPPPCAIHNRPLRVDHVPGLGLLYACPECRFISFARQRVEKEVIEAVIPGIIAQLKEIVLRATTKEIESWKR